jgi:hypothetical protein
MATGNPFQPGSEPSRRRSQRVILSMAVTVRTDGGLKAASFEEDTHTLVVNLHGALIVLAARVAKGQKLLLRNRSTKEEQMCQVASVSPASGGKAQIGVEFLKPSPDFWRISFPPEDWVLPEPSTMTSDD